MDLNKYLRHIPNLTTVANMVLGTLVLFSAISQKGGGIPAGSLHYDLIAVVLDVFDGKIARSLNMESSLGKQLDSFADLISFGLAPMCRSPHLQQFQRFRMAYIYMHCNLYHCGSIPAGQGLIPATIQIFFLGLPYYSIGPYPHTDQYNSAFL